MAWRVKSFNVNTTNLETVSIGWCSCNGIAVFATNYGLASEFGILKLFAVRNDFRYFKKQLYHLAVPSGVISMAEWWSAKIFEGYDPLGDTLVSIYDGR